MEPCFLEAADRLVQLRAAGGKFVPEVFDNRGGRLRPISLLNDGLLCFQVAESDVASAASHLEVFDGKSFKVLGDAPNLSFGGSPSCVFVAQNGDLWLGGDSGTAVSHDNKWRTFVASDGTVPRAPLGFAELPDGRLWCATQEKIWEFDGRNWASVRGGFDRINALRRTRDGSLWVASNNGLFRFFQNAWVEIGVEEGLPSAASCGNSMRTHAGVCGRARLTG